MYNLHPMINFKSLTTPEIKKLFKRYMVVKDTKEDAHAKLSASGSERWLGCPGSVRLSAGIPEQPNEWSIAGTNAHTLMQFIFENFHNHKKFLASPAAKAFKEFIDYSDEQYTAVMMAVDFVKEEQASMEKTGNKPELLIEKKVELEGVGFGTSDIILAQPFGVLHVMDYKNGRSIVEPEENTQALYYAHAAADLYGWDFSEIWITIIQPNAPHKKGPIRTWKTTTKRVEQEGKRFRLGAKLTKKKDAPLVTNPKWCWFCPARSICPEQMKGKEVKIMDRFSKQKDFSDVY